MAKKPDFIVYGRTLEGGHWKKIGVAWRNKANNKTKTSYVRIALDFRPTTGELTLWKIEDRVDAEDHPEIEDAKLGCPFGVEGCRGVIGDGVCADCLAGDT